MFLPVQETLSQVLSCFLLEVGQGCSKFPTSDRKETIDNKIDQLEIVAAAFDWDSKMRLAYLQGI